MMVAYCGPGECKYLGCPQIAKGAEMPSTRKKHFEWARRVSSIPAIATLLCTSHALAAAPAVVVDAQQTIGTGNFNPLQVVVAPNGTVYVADTFNSRILQATPGLPGQVNFTQVNTGSANLSFPEGIAVDASGDLYICDTPVNFGLGFNSRILEVKANSNGSLTTNVTQLYSGPQITLPTSLTIDSSNTLFIGVSQIFGGGAIYSLAAGSGTLQTVKTGLFGFTPAALARDAGSNLYFVDSGANSGGIYKVPATGGNAQPVSVGSFNLSAPSGVALDPAGDLFVLATLTSGRNAVVDIPAASPATPYLIPISNLQNLNNMALDPNGNIDVAGQTFNGFVTQLNFSNPVYLGGANVSGAGSAVLFNIEFNAPATFGGFRTVTVGDLGTSSNHALADVAPATTGNCKNPISGGTTAYAPYACVQTFEATPQYTGTRISAIQVEGPTTAGKTAILDSTPVYETGNSSAQITYPLDANATALGLIQPQGITASGFDQTVYVADLAGGAVFSVNGLSGSSPNQVSTGGIPLSAPSAVAMNGEGDLFIADYNLGEVVVVPTTTGKAPYVLNTGTLLQHPIALALDVLGDLYIGDSGQAGEDASGGNPGYVVEVPYNGSAINLPTPGVNVIFPQALAADSLNGNLWIGDGGDLVTAGQLVKVPANGSNASAVGVAGVADPTGLTFDAAENLYILDGNANTITVMSATGNSHLLSFAGASLVAPSALVSSAGSQSFVIANIGDGNSNSLIFLNGNSTTLAFGNQATNSTSQTQTATVANIGNQNLTLSRPDFTIKNSNRAFSILGSSTCAAGDTLTFSSTCTFNVQFAPTAVGAQGEQVTVQSRAYNSGTPQINLTGTGTSTGKAQVVLSSAGGIQAHISGSGRKSFRAAKTKTR
jgi:sugar lactone lactonase YvrE